LRQAVQELQIGEFDVSGHVRLSEHTRWGDAPFKISCCSRAIHMELIRRGRIVFSRAPLIIQSTDAGRARVRHCRADFANGGISNRAGACARRQVKT
jgi:hypothetical protein